MEMLFCIMLMLIAVLISNIIGKLFPFIAAPIINIGLGALISLLPIAHGFEIEHEMFLFLFVAPLAYYGGMTINRSALWKMKGSVANMAIILVIISGIIVGSLINLLIPAIGLLTAFILMASLGPTDHIAVDNVERHSHIPEHMMEMLKGESVLAEVTSVILFQTGISVLADEHFNAGYTVLEFLWLLIGGIIVGLALSIIRMSIVRWLCNTGIKSQSIHTLLSIIFPIIVFLIAEKLEVSGILAIFIAGIFSAYDYRKENPDNARLTLASKNIWKTLSFSLDGLVFVYLGMEIPKLTAELFEGHFPISFGWILLTISLVSLALFAIRFIWAFITLPVSVRNEKKHEMSRLRAALLFAMSGARGAITMATVAAIPITLADGSLFPERDLMMIIAMGVIICSVLVSYIFLPIIAPKAKKGSGRKPDDETYHDILQSVIDELKKQSTPDNMLETEIIIHRYIERQRKLNIKRDDKKNTEEYELNKRIIQWKEENINNLLAGGTISQETADYFFALLRQDEHKIKSSSLFSDVRRFLVNIGMRSQNKAENDSELIRVYPYVLKSNTEYVLEQLKSRQLTDPSEICGKYIQENERLLQQMLGPDHDINAEIKPIDNKVIRELTRKSLYLERDTVQQFYEEGILTYSTAHSMKKNIALIEYQMD